MQIFQCDPRFSAAEQHHRMAAAVSKMLLFEFSGLIFAQDAPALMRALLRFRDRKKTPALFTDLVLRRIEFLLALDIVER